MKNLLSIGEVSKIKAVSHRMLRHYDKLGILVPVHVNEETGYRYYSKSQMIILDLIFVCTDLGIPLRSINDYISEDGSYDVAAIVETGKRLATERLKKTNETIYRLNSIEKRFMMTDRSQSGIVRKYIEERYFFSVEVDESDDSIETYWSRLSEMYEKAGRRGLICTVNMGQYVVFSEGAYGLFVYIEVAKPKKAATDIRRIPSGNFDCEVFEDEEYEIAKKKYLKDYPEGTIIIIEDVIETRVSDKMLPIEIQLSVSEG